MRRIRTGGRAVMDILAKPAGGRAPRRGRGGDEGQRWAKVARYGYRTMMRGTTVAIHGLVSRILDLPVRLTPRPLAAAVSSRIMAEG